MSFYGFLSWPGLNQGTSTFLDGTQSLPGGEQATIPHLKEDILGFHMIPNTKFLLVKLHCSGQIIPLPESALVG